jgi:hypothetical protein
MKVTGYAMILRITEAKVVGPHILRLAFNDWTLKTVDVFPLLDGPVFAPLQNPEFFARAAWDPVSGTVFWPNDADFAPEALHALRSVEETSVA